MRNAFAEIITELASKDERIVLLSGDIGNRLFENFKTLQGNRFFNCGVAEANMATVAGGLAHSGMKPVTYTITPFNTTRCLEQIKIDVCYHNLPVVVVGTGAGLSYASLGSTHHSCEDLAIMRAMPNMTIFTPADALEVKAAMRTALAHNGPCYVRIGKKNEPVVHSEEPVVRIGGAMVMREGSDVAILSAGNILPQALKAADLLARNVKVSARVVHFPTIKPLDGETIAACAAECGKLVTVEEHGLIGGFGGAVAEFAVDARITTPILRCGSPDRFLKSTGGQEAAREEIGISGDKLCVRIQEFLGK